MDFSDIWFLTCAYLLALAALIFAMYAWRSAKDADARARRLDDWYNEVSKSLTALSSDVREARAAQAKANGELARRVDHLEVYGRYHAAQHADAVRSHVDSLASELGYQYRETAERGWVKEPVA